MDTDTCTDFGNPRGALLGVLSAILPLGCVVASPFVSYVGDGYGRRAGIFFGCVIMAIGGIIQGASINCKLSSKPSSLALNLTPYSRHVSRFSFYRRFWFGLRECIRANAHR